MLISPRCSTCPRKQRRNQWKSSCALYRDGHTYYQSRNARASGQQADKTGIRPREGRWVSHGGGRASNVTYNEYTGSSRGCHATMSSLPSHCMVIARRPENISAVVMVRLLAVYRGSVLLHCCGGCVLGVAYCCPVVIFSHGCVHKWPLTRRTR